MELHKAGRSFRDIDRALGLGNDTSRKFLSSDELPKNALGAKIGTQAPSVLPLANTEDRSDTRLDAASP